MRKIVIGGLLLSLVGAGGLQASEGGVELEDVPTSSAPSSGRSNDGASEESDGEEVAPVEAVAPGTMTYPETAPSKKNKFNLLNDKLYIYFPKHNGKYFMDYIDSLEGQVSDLQSSKDKNFKIIHNYNFSYGNKKEYRVKLEIYSVFDCYYSRLFSKLPKDKDFLHDIKLRFKKIINELYDNNICYVSKIICSQVDELTKFKKDLLKNKEAAQGFGRRFLESEDSNIDVVTLIDDYFLLPLWIILADCWNKKEKCPVDAESARALKDSWLGKGLSPEVIKRLCRHTFEDITGLISPQNKALCLNELFKSSGKISYSSYKDVFYNSNFESLRLLIQEYIGNDLIKSMSLENKNVLKDLRNQLINNQNIGNLSVKKVFDKVFSRPVKSYENINAWFNDNEVLKCLEKVIDLDVITFNAFVDLFV